MSSGLEMKEVGTMWKSEYDILKDLALLNDFGDREPYRILYSNGRGSSMKQRNKSPEKFVDPRTGEVIEVDNSELQNSNWRKGKGRGHFGSFSVKKFQLQQQLRMARPLGSGDEAIESFCRRNQPRGNSTSTSDSDVDSQNPQSSISNSGNPVTRVKGIRNSGPKSNALINSLLSKADIVTDTDDDNSRSDTTDNSGNNDCCKINDNNSVTGNKWEDCLTYVYEAKKGEELGKRKKKNAGNENSSYEIIDLCDDSEDSSSDKTMNPSVQNENRNEKIREIEKFVPKWVNAKESVKTYCITDDEDFPPLHSNSTK